MQKSDPHPLRRFATALNVHAGAIEPFSGSLSPPINRLANFSRWTRVHPI
jgi:hypothetical protein